MKTRTQESTLGIIAGGGDLSPTSSLRQCDWLTQEQQARLHDNSGFEFSQHEAGTIADTLQKMVDDWHGCRS